MSRETFLSPLESLEAFRITKEKLKKAEGICQLSGCVESQKVHMAYALGAGYKKKLILTYSEKKAKEIYEEYRFFEPEAKLYPAVDFLFFHADIQSNQLLQQRMTAINALLRADDPGKDDAGSVDDGVTIITTFDGCMDKLNTPEEMRKVTEKITVGDILEMNAWAAKLVFLGYERTFQAEMPGQFALRGGILDVYPLTEENPVRIELWDDEVDSIRTFDPESQRSLENLQEVTITPASEMTENRDVKKLVSLLDYFKGKDGLVVLDEPAKCLEWGRAVEKELRESLANRAEKGEELPEKTRLFTGAEEVLAKINGRPCAGLCLIEPGRTDFSIVSSLQADVRSINPYHNSFELLVKDLKKWKKEKCSVVLLCSSRTRARRLAQDLLDEELNSFYSEDLDRKVNPTEIMVTPGSIRQGYEYPMLKFVVLSETDIFGQEKKKKRRRHRAYEGEVISSFSELSVGDYVVHENHGLGIYKGIEKVEVDKVLKDYIKIEYAGGSNLYILATQLDAIQKYSGGEGKQPRINKLGGTEWTKTKSKVQTAVQEIAQDLVDLYAARQQKNGFVYGPDTLWQKEFEELFPFEETEDQQLAIEATKRDMESTKIMDRLICGDVGYGKTEIAIRAAFKAVQENKQVVYLVPTTILAQQHYTTFVQRMQEFPVRVDLLSRFRTPTQQKKTVKDLEKGFVDIVIGTHRVLSDDVKFKDLGLLIIDEEQRFGVTHKEKIKKLKENVDVLTLTATPIPRTLHMSIVGIRDMSILEEAPQDRVPIQTYVCEQDDEMVRAAINRELSRGGQVYFVYNRVQTIAEMAGHIQSLVPDANVEYAHGQMRENELERIMYDFIQGDIDVLVTTTIIETGLDISNVNTIIIHDADNMGLSQLYQLRGRVGRSNRTAYAFLMYRKNKMLKEVAEKRLSAIREFTDLGSGFKIAMRDLEIRGAGNLLGQRQHGHMADVGYDLYCKMLSEAVHEIKGDAPEDHFATVVEIDIDAYIPDTYIKDENQKLDVYKRIAGIQTEEEKDDMQDELIDRFGDLPRAVQNLLTVAEIKLMAHEVYVTEVTQREREIVFSLYERAKLRPEMMADFIASFNGNMKFIRGTTPAFIYSYRKNSRDEKTAVVDTVRNVLGKMRDLL